MGVLVELEAGSTAILLGFWGNWKLEVPRFRLQGTLVELWASCQFLIFVNLRVLEPLVLLAQIPLDRGFETRLGPL